MLLNAHNMLLNMNMNMNNNHIFDIDDLQQEDLELIEDGEDAYLQGLEEINDEVVHEVQINQNMNEEDGFG